MSSNNALDPHGQPYNVLFNRARRTERDLAEMLGIAKGMVCDGIVNADEARYLRDWGKNHPDALEQWPINLIFSRLHQYFADGQVDEAERVELQELLAALVGGTASLLLGYEAPATLPLDDPKPLVCWGPDDVYVFTGRFAYGTRKDCEHEAMERRSTCEANVTRRTSFLVIGSFGSRDWQHSSFGAKIRRAVKLRDSGFAIRIIGEDHFVNALALTPQPVEESPF
jgi:hypothetical protein